MFDKDMLKSILAAYGPSGREQTVSDVIRSYVEPFADEVYNDTLGNLIAVKKGTSGKKVMLSAHMDQIGLIVVDIDEKGFLRVSNVGGVNPVVSLAREVQFENGTHGVTYFETEKHGAKDATMPELFVDIGATTREEAEAKVQIGDVAVYVTNFVEMGSRVSSGALDDRIACAAVVEAFRTMQNVHDVYAVFTVQEEVGLRGANLDVLARAPFWEQGLDYKHGTGHGVGYLLNVHEGPNSFRWHKSPTRNEDTVQEPGMVTTDEPGVYIEGSHGIRTENELVCRKLEENEYGQFLGFETITCAPIDLDAVIPEQMSPRQRGWLNDYHAFVRETLLPLMQDDDERAWLRHATRAI